MNNRVFTVHCPAYMIRPRNSCLGDIELIGLAKSDLRVPEFKLPATLYGETGASAATAAIRCASTTR